MSPHLDDWVLRPMMFAVRRVPLHHLIQAALLGMSIFMMVKAAHNEPYRLPLFVSLPRRAWRNSKAAGSEPLRIPKGHLPRLTMYGMKTSRMDRQVRRMREDWDQRARENARYYVATERDQWSDEEFFRSGEATLEEQILSDLENICQGRDPKNMRVLEIGCGAGRVTRALSGFFGQVYAVDISAEMVRRARRALKNHPNARVFRNNGKDLSAIREHWWDRFGLGRRPQFDFAFSCIVFQHIPSRVIIENYVREVNRALRPGGLFKFQVQGGKQSESQVEDSWVGVAFTEEEAREMAERNGFEMRHHNGAGDQDYWLWFFKDRERA
jgi:SAM-dependent methyltransferase